MGMSWRGGHAPVRAHNPKPLAYRQFFASLRSGLSKRPWQALRPDTLNRLAVHAAGRGEAREPQSSIAARTRSKTSTAVAFQSKRHGNTQFRV